MPGSRVSTVLALVLGTLMATSPVPVAAEAVEVLPQALPSPASMACAVAAGNVVYVFGGFTQGALLDTIVEVDPATGTSRVLEDRLPSPRKLSSAVWTGEAAYVIGGVGYDGDPLAEVVRFAPGEGVELLEGAIPWGTKGVGAAWSGERVYVFGNCLSASTGQHDVLVFDPATNSSEVLEDALPVPGAGSSVVWAGDSAYIFGGRLNRSFSDRIFRFHPTLGASVVGVRLPSGRFGTAAAWDGARAYVAGGSVALVCGPSECVPTDFLDEIVVFDPRAGSSFRHWARLPSPRDVRAAAWAGDRVLVLGGETGKGPVDEVVSFDPSVPFVEDTEEAGGLAVLALAVSGSAVLLAAVALTFRRRLRKGREGPPPMAGGPLQG